MRFRRMMLLVAMLLLMLGMMACSAPNPPAPTTTEQAGGMPQPAAPAPLARTKLSYEISVGDTTLKAGAQWYPSTGEALELTMRFPVAMDRETTTTAIGRSVPAGSRIDWVDDQTLTLHVPPQESRLAFGAAGALSHDGTGEVVGDLVTITWPPVMLFTRYRAEDLMAGSTEPVTAWPYQAWVDGFALAPDGETVLLFTADGLASSGPPPVLMHMPTGKVTPLTDGTPWPPLLYAGWLPDGKLLLVGPKVWLGGPRGEGLREITSNPGCLIARPSPSGTALALWGYKGTAAVRLRMLNLQTGALTDAQVDFHQGPVLEQNVFAWSPDGKLLAGTDYQGEDAASVRTRIIDAATGAEVRSMADTHLVAWLADGTLLVEHPDLTATRADRNSLFRIDAHGSATPFPATGAQASPDGKFLLLTTASGVDMLMEVATGKSVKLSLPIRPKWTNQHDLMTVARRAK